MICGDCGAPLGVGLIVAAVSDSFSIRLQVMADNLVVPTGSNFLVMRRAARDGQPSGSGVCDRSLLRCC